MGSITQDAAFNLVVYSFLMVLVPLALFFSSFYGYLDCALPYQRTASVTRSNVLCFFLFRSCVTVCMVLNAPPARPMCSGVQPGARQRKRDSEQPADAQRRARGSGRQRRRRPVRRCRLQGAGVCHSSEEEGLSNADQ